MCFLHAWADPGNEIRARDVLAQRLPGTWFTTSSEVVPEFREYERFSTTVINAYLLPVIDCCIPRSFVTDFSVYS